MPVYRVSGRFASEAQARRAAGRHPDKVKTCVGKKSYSGFKTSRQIYGVEYRAKRKRVEKRRVADMRRAQAAALAEARRLELRRKRKPKPAAPVEVEPEEIPGEDFPGEFEDYTYSTEDLGDFGEDYFIEMAMLDIDDEVIQGESP